MVALFKMKVKERLKSVTVDPWPDEKYNVVDLFSFVSDR